MHAKLIHNDLGKPEWAPHLSSLLPHVCLCIFPKPCIIDSVVDTYFDTPSPMWGFTCMWRRYSDKQDAVNFGEEHWKSQSKALAAAAAREGQLEMIRSIQYYRTTTERHTRLQRQREEYQKQKAAEPMEQRVLSSQSSYTVWSEYSIAKKTDKLCVVYSSKYIHSAATELATTKSSHAEILKQQLTWLLLVRTNQRWQDALKMVKQEASPSWSSLQARDISNWSIRLWRCDSIMEDAVSVALSGNNWGVAVVVPVNSAWSSISTL